MMSNGNGGAGAAGRPISDRAATQKTYQRPGGGAAWSGTGKPIAQVARDLGINEGTLGNWVALDRQRRDGEGGQVDEDGRAELVRLRREVAELRMRCDVLKRSVALWVSDAMGSR